MREGSYGEQSDPIKDKEPETFPTYDAAQDVRMRVAILEAKACRLEKEMETMTYIVMGAVLLLFVVIRRVAFREDVPGLEP